MWQYVIVRCTYNKQSDKDEYTVLAGPLFLHETFSGIDAQKQALVEQAHVVKGIDPDEITVWLLKFQTARSKD